MEMLIFSYLTLHSFANSLHNFCTNIQVRRLFNEVRNRIMHQPNNLWNTSYFLFFFNILDTYFFRWINSRSRNIIVFRKVCSPTDSISRRMNLIVFRIYVVVLSRSRISHTFVDQLLCSSRYGVSWCRFISHGRWNGVDIWCCGNEGFIEFVRVETK